MISFLECVPCIIEQAGYVLDQTDFSKEKKKDILEEISLFVKSNFPQKAPMYIATDVHRKLRNIIKKDPYADVKDISNDFMLKETERIKKYFEKNKNNLETMVKLVIAGNIIDIKTEKERENLNIDVKVNEIIKKDIVINFIDDFKKFLKPGNKLLYLGDNAGEIFFDRFFIEYLKEFGLDITFVVRGDTVINDATMIDAKIAGLDKVVKVIDNGYDAPGTCLEMCSDEFNEIYEKADFVISKGQGNF
ncbi:MAG: ARMT1-like domain-containing protein, partial [Candidatus Muirbacterium halophilum]|nr:ARMT1-like domain-containing protein [Candidatus Muirbacterium halophilum]